MFEGRILEKFENKIRLYDGMLVQIERWYNAIGHRRAITACNIYLTIV